MTVRIDRRLRGRDGGRALPLALLSVVLTLAAALLVHVGHGRLAGPADWSPSGIADWSRGRDSLTLAMAVIRLGALATIGRLGLAAVLAGFGGALRLPGLLRAADWMSLPGTRSLIHRIAGLGLSAASLSTPLATTPSHHATLRTIEATADAHGGGTVTLQRSLEPRRGGGQATIRVERNRVGRGTAAVTIDADATSDPPAASTPSAPTSPTPTPPAPPLSAPGGAARSSWTVRPGDHLWSISERVLSDRWGRSPTELEVDRYWQAVVRANPQLVDADLLFSGEAVHLPPVPDPPR